MADFEVMATAKFEAYEVELAKKEAIIASLRDKVAKLEAELERYRKKDKTKAVQNGKARLKSVKKQVAQYIAVIESLTGRQYI